MAAEDFFSRWSKKKTDASTPDADLGSAENIKAVADIQQPEKINSDTAVKSVPTQEDVDKLTHDSDYSAFMSQGVDESVKRSAMKKLFTDPHFNIMDGLDIYIDDYNKFEPITPALLASLSHAKHLLDPLSQLKTPFMRLLDKIPEANEAVTDSEALEIHEQIGAAEGGVTEQGDEGQMKEYVEQQASQDIQKLSQQARDEELSIKNVNAKPDADDV